MKRKIIATVLAAVMLIGLIPSVVSLLTADAASIGDVNGDGSVDNLDAALVLKYDAAIIELTEAQLSAADVSGDKSSDNLDAAMILRYDAGIIENFPAEEFVESAESEEEAFISSEDETSVIQYPEGAYIVKTYSAENDIVWDSVPKAEIDIYKWVNSVEYEAYAQLVYIKGYGFLCRMTCMEEDPLARYTQFGDPVYLDSCMEFFAAWDNRSYINIESNSVGAMCSQFGATNSNRKPITDYLSMDEIFEVNPVVEDDRWTLTMDIPIAKLQRFYGTAMNSETFVSGYTFTGNFYKIGSDAVTGVRHYGMWTEVYGNTPNFHQPDSFGTLVIE